MNQQCWAPTAETGFLMSPDPIEDLAGVDQPLETDATGQLLDMARTLPARIANHSIRADVKAMPVFDMSAIAEVTDFRITERLFQIYSTLANSYVWCDQSDPSTHLPKSIALPLVQLADLVERPPIVPYASTGLMNFQRLDQNGSHALENLKCIQKMVDIPDESWFHLVHVEIEARAGAAIFALIEASRLANLNDASGVEAELTKVLPVFDKMIRSFRRITEHCNTDVYYHTLRPYLFGFDGVIYEGVAEFEGKPMTFMGESGAQSTVIPAIKALIGLQHSKGGLSEDLLSMQAYMPKPHRALLANIDSTAIRSFGAIAGVRRIKNPITLARAIMEKTEQVMFVGEDADRIARSLGLDWIENESLVIPAMRAFFEAQKTDGPNDTVGAIALDQHGNFAAATSTSGTPFKPAGRVGDSPFFGAGRYAENGVGAAGATGQGEQIMRTLLSKFLCDRMAEGQNAQAAAVAATAHFDSKFPDSMSGVIAIDPQGGVGLAQSAPKMTCAWVGLNGEVMSRVKG